MRIRHRALIGLVLLAAAFLLDAPVAKVLGGMSFFHDWGELREGLIGAKFLGSGLGSLVVGAAVGLVDRRRWRRAGVVWLVAAVAGLGGVALKSVAGRERPFLQDEAGEVRVLAFHGPARGLREAPCRSFPSGHTIGAFASATCLSAFYPQARAVFYAVAVCTGVNRVVKRQHYLSDVVAGALLAHFVALWVLARSGVRRLWRSGPVDSEEPGA